MANRVHGSGRRAITSGGCRSPFIELLEDRRFFDIDAPATVSGGSFTFTSGSGSMTLVSPTPTVIGQEVTVVLDDPAPGADSTSTRFDLRNSAGEVKASGYWEYMVFGGYIGYLTINDRTHVPANLLSNPIIADTFSFSLQFETPTSGNFVATGNILNGGGRFTFSADGGTGGIVRNVPWNGAGPHNGGVIGEYTITDLGTLGGGPDAYTLAYGLNDSGRVVGESHTPKSLLHAFSGTSGGLTDHSFSERVYSAAYAINDLGRVSKQ